VKAAFPHLACLPIDGIDNVFPLAGVHLLNALKQIQGILCLQLSRSTNLLAHLDLTVARNSCVFWQQVQPGP